MLRQLLAPTVVLLVITSAAIAQQSSGWWVIIGSFSAENTPAMSVEFRQVTAAAARCGLQSFNDFSSKFRGRPFLNCG